MSGTHNGAQWRVWNRPASAALASVLLLLTLLLSACSFTDTSGQGGAGGNSSVAGSDQSATPTNTVDSSSGGAGTGTGTPTPTTSPGSPPTFSVTGITMSVSPSTFSGTCSSTKTFTFTATIQVPAGTGGGTVTYRWLRSDNASATNQTVAFAAGQTSKTVTTTWALGAIWGDGSTNWEKVASSAPNVWYSPAGNFSFHCQVAVSSASLAVHPTCWSNTGIGTFTFSGTFTVTPGPASSITYIWKRSDGGQSGTPLTLAIPAGATSVTIPSVTWTMSAPQPLGTYWEEVITSAPNAYTSPHASFVNQSSICL